MLSQTVKGSRKLLKIAGVRDNRINFTRKENGGPVVASLR